MSIKKTLKRIGLILPFLLILNQAYATDHYCTSCTDCSQKISSANPGDTVYLTGHITGATQTCITFDSTTNIELNCQGHIIEGERNYGTYGIHVNAGSQNKINHCQITSFHRGVNTLNTQYNVISSNIILNNSVGTYLYESAGNIIILNRMISNSGGIFLRSSNQNTANNNNITSQEYLSYGISLQYSTGNTLTSNTLNARDYGIKLISSNQNTLTSNTACNHQTTDIYLNSTSTNQGTLNTCDTTNGWNDNGETGCTNSCTPQGSTTTSTSTTSTTTTTSTTLPQVPEIFFCTPASINPDTGVIECSSPSDVSDELGGIDNLNVTVASTGPTVVLTNFSVEYDQLRVYGVSDNSQVSNISLTVRSDGDTDGIYEDLINESWWYNIAPYSQVIDVNFTVNTTLPLLFIPRAGTISLNYIGPATSTTTSTTTTTTTTSTTSTTSTTLLPNQCNSCQSCNQAIASASPGDTIYLTGDITITEESETCILMNETSGVTFNCQDHDIIGSYNDSHSTWGVGITYGSENKLASCDIRNFTYGLYVFDESDLEITGNTINQNMYGVLLWKTVDSTFTENTVNANTKTGLIIGPDSRGNTIELNTINNNEQGLSIRSGSQDNQIEQNTLCENSVFDINASTESEATGYDNRCLTANLWNDTGVEGCKYECQIGGENPDLVITDIWSAGIRLYYRIKNQGAVAADPSSSSLFVDSIFQTLGTVIVINVDGEKTRSFPYLWNCSGESDEVIVCADALDEIPESSEVNNCRTEEISCNATGSSRPGDANFDGVVDYDDLLILGQAYGTSHGDQNYNPAADFDLNGKVDYEDLLILAANYDI